MSETILETGSFFAAYATPHQSNIDIFAKNLISSLKLSNLQLDPKLPNNFVIDTMFSSYNFYSKYASACMVMPEPSTAPQQVTRPSVFSLAPII